MSPLSDDVVAQHMRLVRAMSRENEPLSSRGSTATVRNPRWYTPQGQATPRRNALHEELVALAIARSPGTTAGIPEGAQPPGENERAPLIGASDGRPRAVVMAGPPGAGKSTVRAQLLGAEADAWMVIDADAFKDALIDRALEDGSYDAWIKPEAVRTLEAGGERFFPLEMSALLQAESGQLAQLQRNQAVAAGRDILIDTVLWNQTHARGIGAQLQAAGYAISVVDVEVPYELSMARVMARWEATYREAMAGRDERGGRWVPSEYARVVYGGPSGTRGPSLCEATARELAQTCPAVVSYRLFRAQLPRDVDPATALAIPARLETAMIRERDGGPLIASPTSGSADVSSSRPPTGLSSGLSAGLSAGLSSGVPQVPGPASRPADAVELGAVAPPDGASSGTAPRSASSTSARAAGVGQDGGSAVWDAPAQRAQHRRRRERDQERDRGREGPAAGQER